MGKESLFEDDLVNPVEDPNKTDIEDITDDTQEAKEVVERVEENEKEKENENASDDVVKDDEEEVHAETPETDGESKGEDEGGNGETTAGEGVENGEEVKTESTFFYVEASEMGDEIDEVTMNDTYLGDTETLTIKETITIESVPLDRNTQDTVILNNPTGVFQYLVLGQEPIEEYTRQLDYIDGEFNNIVESIEGWLTAQRLGRPYELHESLILTIPPSTKFEGAPIHLPDAVALQYFLMMRNKIKVQFMQSILSSMSVDNEQLPEEVKGLLAWINYLLTNDVIDSYITALTNVEVPQ